MLNKTSQEIFDIVVSHLRRQKSKSMVSEEEGCIYHSSNGMKCAIGCLITNKEYHSSIEGKTVYELTNLKSFAWMNEHLLLLNALQLCHDSILVTHWENRFAKIAEEFGLTLCS
jgi:hypothetical protein